MTIDQRDTRNMGGSWPHSMPWIVKATQERCCERHGPFLGRLYEGVHPENWQQRSNQGGLDALKPYIADWWSKCPTCNAEIRDEQEMTLAEVMSGEEAAERLRHQMALAAGIPQRYAGLTVEDFHPLFDRMNGAVAHVKAYCGAMGVHRRDGRGMLLIGPIGTGKTHASSVIAGAACREGLSVRWTTEDAMFRRIRDTWGERGDSEADAVAAFTDPDLLVIDELGRRDRGEHGKRLLDTILDERYAQVRPTVITTNLSRQRLEGDLGESIWSRIRSTMRAVVFNWQNLREEGARHAV